MMLQMDQALALRLAIAFGVTIVPFLVGRFVLFRDEWTSREQPHFADYVVVWFLGMLFILGLSAIGLFVGRFLYWVVVGD